MRYLGDGAAACPVCDGYGLNLDNGETCGYCDGIGSLLLDHFEPVAPRINRSHCIVWSTLLCDPATIERETD